MTDAGLTFFRMRNMKTKRVHGVDCNSRCFAYVGDLDDTATWHACVHVLGDTAKTVNAVKTSLGRFQETKGIPDGQRQEVWATLRGAALALGIQVRAAENAPARVTPAPKPVVEEKPLKRDKRAEAIFADADRKASAFLKSLGYE